LVIADDVGVGGGEDGADGAAAAADAAPKPKAAPKVRITFHFGKVALLM